MRALICGALLLAACSDTMFDGSRAEQAAHAIAQKIGGDAKVARVLVRADSLRLNAADPGRAGALLNWSYEKNKVIGPRQVILEGSSFTGQVPLVPLAEVDFKRLPGLVREAKKQQGHEITEADLQFDPAHPDQPPSWKLK